MIEKGRYVETGGKLVSILSKDFAGRTLSITQEVLTKDGFLKPMICMQFDYGERIILPLNLPDTTEEKQIKKYYSTLGIAVQRTGRRILEALTVSVGLCYTHDEVLSEGITVIGRDRLGKHGTVLVQPFVFDTPDRLILDPLVIEVYNEPIKSVFHPFVLLDSLFFPSHAQRKSTRFH